MGKGLKIMNAAARMVEDVAKGPKKPKEGSPAEEAAESPAEEMKEQVKKGKGRAKPFGK